MCAQNSDLQIFLFRHKLSYFYPLYLSACPVSKYEKAKRQHDRGYNYRYKINLGWQVGKPDKTKPQPQQLRGKQQAYGYAQDSAQNGRYQKSESEAQSQTAHRIS